MGSLIPEFIDYKRIFPFYVCFCIIWMDFLKKSMYLCVNVRCNVLFQHKYLVLDLETRWRCMCFSCTLISNFCLINLKSCYLIFEIYNLFLLNVIKNHDLYFPDGGTMADGVLHVKHHLSDRRHRLRYILFSRTTAVGCRSGFGR